MPKRKPSQKTAETDLLIGLVIDRSGSMSAHKAPTIEGINGLLAEQRALAGTAYVSMTLFNTGFDIRHVALDVREVPDLDHHTYQPASGTALYDAVGITIEGIDLWLQNHPEFVGKVSIGVWTDGLENSSHRYHLRALMDVIDERQKAGWDFMFLGAGGAAWTEGENFASTIGQFATASVAPTYAGVRSSYAGASKRLAAMRTGGPVMDTATAYASSLAETKDDDYESAVQTISGDTT